MCGKYPLCLLFANFGDLSLKSRVILPSKVLGDRGAKLADFLEEGDSPSKILEMLFLVNPGYTKSNFSQNQRPVKSPKIPGFLLY